MSANLKNIILFQIAWWGIVLSASYSLPALSLLVAGSYLLVHFRFLGEFKTDGRIIAISGLLGLTTDFMCQYLGLFRLEGHWFLSKGLPPEWLIYLWLCFPTTLNLSLAFLQDRLHWAVLAGAIFGPLTYYAGEAFDLLKFGEPKVTSIIVFALVWAILFPATLKFAKLIKVSCNSLSEPVGE